MTQKDRIEAKVLPILQALWRAGSRATPKANNVIEVLDPSNAARLLNASVEPVATIPGGNGQGFRTAGMLDRASRRILVSEEFKPEEIRFTVAHEVGHLVLHHQQSLFRDRPMRGLADYLRRPAIEAEADHFAACLLMPRNLVLQQFEHTFGARGSFIFDERWAFALCPSDPESLLLGDGCVQSRALAIAGARYFNGRNIHPLHQQFRVSVGAMAIRLVELGLTGRREPFESTDAPMQSVRTPAPLFGAGLHHVSEGELEAIFASPFVRSGRRLQLIESLRRFLQFVRQIGINCEIWIDGSFATDKLEPDDIDVVVFIYPGQVNTLPSDRYSQLELLNDRPLMRAKYACDVYVDRAHDDQRRDYYFRTFGADGGIEKGIPVLNVVG